MRSDKLANGIRILRVSNSLEEVEKFLQSETYDHQDERFVLDLVARPLVAGLPWPSGTLHAPIEDTYHIFQYVRIDKLGLLQRASTARKSDQSARAFTAVLLDTLAEHASCDLRDAEIQWLGDVIVAERARATAWWEPVRSAENDSCRAFDVFVTPGLPSVHVQVRVTGVDGMCLCDRLLEWHADDHSSQRISLSEELGAVFLRAWVDSQLVVEDQGVLVRGFNGTVSLVSSSYIIQDRLTRKLQGAVRGRAASAQLLSAAQKGQSTGMSTRLSSQMKSEAWSGLGRTAEAVLDFVLPPAPDYGYFPRGAEGRTQAVLHFAELLATAEQAYLIDPWFDATGAEALLPRVRGDVRLTVVTNLPSPRHREDRNQLEALLQSASAMGLPENLEVVCLSGARPEKPIFHDRFVLLRNDARWRGFVLTNSFSGLAADYSLFVVEAPFGTTALLLEELEELLAKPNITATRLWPPPRPVAVVRSERGEFPTWRLFLQALVPRVRGAERTWLRAAEARGFLVLTEDGMKWRMTPAAREKALRWLLDQPRAKSHTRPGRGRVRRGSNARIRASSGFDLGESVLLLGNLRARGLEVEAHDVGKRLRVGAATQIEVALRDSFRDDRDPTLLRYKASRERLGLRQNLSEDVPLARAAWAGLSLWCSGIRLLGRSNCWDRCFGYAVLAYLAPQRAVSLCEEYLDADLVLALAGPLHQCITVWSDALAVALVRSRSPVLRAFGAQSLVHSSFEATNTTGVEAPRDVAGAVVRLRQASLSDEEIARYLIVWGVAGQTHLRDDIARELAQQLANLDPPTLDGIAEQLFEQELRAMDLLERLVGALDALEGSWVPAALASMVQRFAMRFRAPYPDIYFSDTVHVQLTLVLSRAVVALSKRRGTTAAHEIDVAAQVADIKRVLIPLSPFRWRKGAAVADAALAWVVLWQMAAASSPNRDGVVEASPEAVQQVLGYLATPGFSQSRSLRAYLRGVLGSAASELPPDPAEAE
jgi:hypothetical protein